MAEIVEGDLAAPFDNHNRIYYWAEWADGRVRKLVEDKDYRDYSRMVAAGRKWAREHGHSLRTRRVPGEKATLIQLVPQITEEQASMLDGEGLT